MATTNHFKFRRQFFLGEKYLKDFANWQFIEIGENLFLSAHPDLEVNQCIKNDLSITLLGYIINPYEPQKSSKELLDDLIGNYSTFNDVLESTYSFSGRWAIIYKNKEEVKIFHDPCGMRQVFYANINNQPYCGSQPSIIAETLNLLVDTDSKIREFIESPKFEASERFWVGDGTVYKEIKHLLPNHYLDISNKQVVRYWINKESDIQRNLRETAEKASLIIKGSIKGITQRYGSMLAVTAGWDSRVLLAASREVKDDLNYFVSTKNALSKKDADIAVPSKLSEKLGLNLKIIDNLPPLRDDFAKMLKENVTMARTIPKTVTIQYHFDNSDRINLNGNASEIVRSYYGNNHPEKINYSYIMNLIGFKSNDYVKLSLQNWLETAQPFAEENRFDIIDLFYWEQRMGNWGTMYQAEQDIAIEEFSPFNNRELLMILTNVEKKYRQSSDYILYQMMIEYLWSDTLSEPINPVALKSKIKRKVASLLPKSIKREIKSLISN